MKNNLLKLASIAMVLFVSSCTSCNRVEPNHEGVLMTNYGRTKDDFSIVVGSQGVLGWGSSLYQVPLYEQKGDCPVMNVTAKGGGVFTIDPTYTYQAIKGKGVDIIFNFKQYASTDSLLESIEKNNLNTLVVNAYKEQARELSTDTILYRLNEYEQSVEKRLRTEFEKKNFELLTLTSGLLPPKSMSDAIEERNNASIKAQTVQNEIKIAQFQLQKDSLIKRSNQIKSDGLSREILQEKYIDMLQNTKNKVIITDGKTPIIFNQ